jgi:hypothetical protein
MHFRAWLAHQMRNPAHPGAAGNTVNQNRLKPCRRRPSGLCNELHSESQNGNPGLIQRKQNGKGSMKQYSKLTQKTVASVAAVLFLLVGAASGWAGSVDLLGNSLDQLLNSGPSSGTGSSNALNGNTSTPKPVTKLSLNGRLTESLGIGGCANNPFVTPACSSSGSCVFVEMSGQVNGIGLGKSNFDACLTIPTASGSGACYHGSGIGTLTAANGKAVKISFGGNYCLDDENTSTYTYYYSTNLTYVVEGGTGPFATETGTGNITTSNIFVFSVSTPIPGIGEISINGNLSKN